MPVAAAIQPPPADTLPDGPILTPGRNCWRVEHASKFAMLVDGEDYFRAVREALRTAERSIFVLGWDIDSRMRLVPEGANDGWPDPFGDFLNALVKARKRLRAYVLSWDFAMLYVIEREWMPIYKLDMRTHRRLSFRMDARHPVGASHHQKIVVVDDSVAFVSGFDITRSRWDTSQHACDDKRRINPLNLTYGPFHDVGAVVEGEAARALGELARERWLRATGRSPRVPPMPPVPGHWPVSTPADLANVQVAIARTEPKFDGLPGAGEIRQLHLDAIAAARQHIYAENQYFTSRTMGDALAARLAEPRAPEIAVVSPKTQSGWLEVSTMGVLRARLDQELRQADRQGRYRLLCPKLQWLDDAKGCLNVHSKVMIVDDSFAMIGSANLSNRSMGFDTECNVAIESGGDERIAQAIAGMRNRLLAEHLGTDAAKVAQVHGQTGSLLKTIDALHDPQGRTLESVQLDLDPTLDGIVPDHTVLDPEEPTDADRLVEDLVREPEARDGARRRIAIFIAVVVVVAALTVAWRMTPLRELMAPERLAALAESLDAHPFAPLGVLAAFVAGGFLLVPVTLMIGASALVFGPVEGALYAFVGALASAAATYAAGRGLGRDAVRRFSGRRLNTLSRRLGQRGLVAMTLIRLVPVAPFSVVNAVAGASHIGWRDFMAGTALGLLPGLVITSAFVDRAVAVVREPGLATVLTLVAVAAVAVGLVLWLRRRLVPLRDAALPDGEHAG
ncbi:MAG TPA: VTT domain-containing protein [Casimicrobiaceae bacterium]|nr:VTT domain-containing protein [Casimicrobiaceae bacterium]